MATLFSTAFSHHFIPLPSATRPAAATSFTCGPLHAVSALLAPRRRLLLPVAMAVSSEFEMEDAEGEPSEGEGGGDSKAEYSEDLKAFVGNLPFTIDSAQLAGLFEQAGSVEMVEIVYNRMTGRSRGFEFVIMGSVEDVVVAVEQFNGYGAGHVYSGFLQPLVAWHEAAIDRGLLELRARARGVTASQLWLVEAARCVSSQLQAARSDWEGATH
ncbi:29 kDa ribonucleoprotein A, chloroplastic-like [Triticum urartu]|uniref:29 kDa ribonucleoprotein A, chloroplastic-like n=1 Tax=Triticum urartu TaxID=4572 RepID=UPI002042EA6F|nr:29 kDa ribonucleoprotein A, chloroplastic-like [Triticum urartu]